LTGYWRVPDDFHFVTAVCSHGFFALAPNAWDAKRAVLSTCVATDGGALHVRVRAARRGGRAVLAVEVPRRERLSEVERTDLSHGLRRILRLDECFDGFQAVCRNDDDLRPAARMRFGRLLRSASFFEDVVKTICTCNITWRQTLSIVRRLVERYGPAAINAPGQAAFPTPERLAAADAAELRGQCGLGYRAEWVRDFARRIAVGELVPASFEDPRLPTDDLYRSLRGIRGVGDYAASSLCILLGRYDRLAVDTEMLAHFRRRFPRRRPTPSNIRRYYARYAPYPALVYWWELWTHYADRRGHPSSWTDGKR